MTRGAGLADKRRLPPGQAATVDEVYEAVGALTHAQLHRLGRFAQYRLEGVRRAGIANSGEDLVQEAVLRTLHGKRSWNKKEVDFIGHVIGVIKSLTSHLGEKDADPTLESDLTRNNEDGNPSSLISTASAATPDAHRVVHGKERVKGIEEYFKDDPLILLIIGGLSEGMAVLEIAAALDVTENDIESAIRKIRRHRKNIATEGRTHA